MVVSDDDLWRYVVPQSEPPSNWIDLDFDDSSWNEGPGGFGYGDGDDRTELTNILTVFQRRVFTIADTSVINYVFVQVDYDDAFVAYLNGEEIGRGQIGVAGDRPRFDQPAGELHEASLYQGSTPDGSMVLDKERVRQLLVEGDNVLAIQTHNGSLSSSDFSSRGFLTVGISDDSRSYRSVLGWFQSPVVGPFFFSSHLPLVVINTEGQGIPNEPKISAKMEIINNLGGTINTTDDTPNDYSGTIGIETRGSSSQGFPKKSYSMETRFPDDTDRDVSIFGFPEEEDWILYAPYTDKSLVRNVLTYDLARMMGRYASRTKFVELIKNGEYEGVYVAMERIKRDSLRVAVSRLKDSDIAGDELTGGYILKVDGGRDPGFRSTYNDPLVSTITWSYYYPSVEDIQPEQDDYIQEEIARFEASFLGDDIANPLTGYPNFIDTDSAVDFMILNEITRNVDGYRLSTFLHKDKDSEGDGKFIFGPIWDFNLGFGNADYYDGGNWVGFQAVEGIPSSDGAPPPHWWKKMFQDSTMNAAIVERWTDLRQNILHTDTVHQMIDDYVTEIGDAADRNFDRWPVLGRYVWPNLFIGDTYQEEIDYLKTWIGNRFNWIDESLENVVTLSQVPRNSVHGFRISDIYPNPLNRNQRLTITPTKPIKIEIEIFDALGRRVRQLLSQSLETNIPWSFDLPADELPTGNYTLRLMTSGSTLHRSFVVIR